MEKIVKEIYEKLNKDISKHFGVISTASKKSQTSLKYEDVIKAKEQLENYQNAAMDRCKASVEGLLGNAYGYKISFSETAVEPDLTPRKIHVHKKWMSESYQARIQKKWNKRFGYCYKPCCYVMGDNIIVNPVFKTEFYKFAARGIGA